VISDGYGVIRPDRVSGVFCTYEIERLRSSEWHDMDQSGSIYPRSQHLRAEYRWRLGNAPRAGHFRVGPLPHADETAGLLKVFPIRENLTFALREDSQNIFTRTARNDLVGDLSSS